MEGMRHDCGEEELMTRGLAAAMLALALAARKHREVQMRVTYSVHTLPLCISPGGFVVAECSVKQRLDSRRTCLWVRVLTTFGMD